MDRDSRRGASGDRGRDSYRKQGDTASLDEVRQLPFDTAAERAVLGALLLSPAAMSDVGVVGLKAEDFYSVGHQHLFEAFAALEASSTAPDHVTVLSYLNDKGKLEEAGGLAYISGLSDSAPSIVNVEQYARIVADKALLRRLLATSQQISAEAMSGQSGKEALDFAESAVFELAQGGGARPYAHIDPVLERAVAELRERYERPDDVTGITTGYRDLDRLLAGLQPSDLIILAARPAMGKTAFALNLATTAALRADRTVMIFSLEMSNEQLSLRMLTAEARVNANNVRTGRLSDSDWSYLVGANDKLSRAQIFMDDKPGASLSEVRSKCRRLKSQQGKLDLVIIDYLQLMTGTGKEQSREQEISGISRGLKGLAKELEAPVVALSQLNRGVESRADKRPMMSDLRESGAIEQDADVIMFLYRDWVYNKASEESLAEVLVRKQRRGSVGDVKLYWHKEYTRFDNLQQEEG